MENCEQTHDYRKYSPTLSQIKQIEESFTYHSPKDTQQERYVVLRNTAKDLARLITECCPPTRETSLALTNLEQSIMWANKSIACNE